MRGMDRARMRLALEQLARALLDHSQWQEGILRAIVRGGPFDPGDPAWSVHQDCGFDRWYFDRADLDAWIRNAKAGSQTKGYLPLRETKKGRVRL
jgi:hypothetical protein